jgi:condensin complex subunit 1
MFHSMCYAMWRQLILRVTLKGGLVRECAILALCKYMCVSSSFCEKNLQLLFSLLSSRNKEDQAESRHRLRANIIVAVGDLAFRFPNLLEPWTKHIYRPLAVRHPQAPILHPCSFSFRSSSSAANNNRTSR